MKKDYRLTKDDKELIRNLLLRCKKQAKQLQILTHCIPSADKKQIIDYAKSLGLLEDI